MPTLTTSSPAVVKAARKMNAIVNEACGTDAEDSWKFYSETYKSDALTALQAAGVGELVEALEGIAAYRPMTFAECSDAEAVMKLAEDAIKTLTGSES